VAETSLTVDGIVHVVESGLINESQWDPQTQTTYVLPKIHSQSGCKQRWGRGGRVQAGIAHCLYTEEQFAQFPAHTDPEIMRAPLEQIVLTAKMAGVSDLKSFDWIQRPSDLELDRAPQFLKDIGALDKDGDLTDHGIELRNFAEETDIANLMILADRFGCAVEMATLIPMRKLGATRVC
jgi:HrpA-like RNA helicase